MKHPAKFSPEIMLELHRQLDGVEGKILDPFAGAGGVHAFYIEGKRWTWGVELESEWARMHAGTEVGDATDLRFPDEMFEAIVTSPCYGNRMADNDPRDTCVTYRSKLGRPLSPNSAGAMQWGEEYKALHRQAWTEAVRVLAPDGIFLLNISDHVRAGQRQKVAGWHVLQLQALGLVVTDLVPICTRRMGKGANRDARVDAELLVRLVKR